MDTYVLWTTLEVHTCIGIFQENTMHYDITLSKFPKYKNIVWGHAVDEETLYVLP